MYTEARPCEEGNWHTIAQQLQHTTTQAYTDKQHVCRQCHYMTVSAIYYVAQGTDL